jgi:uncharacterized membrane protein YkvA (DUF1232 family)
LSLPRSVAILLSRLAIWADTMTYQRTAGWDTGACQWEARNADDEPRLRRRFWSKAKRLGAALPFAEDLLAAYYCAFDRDTPLQVKAVLAGALAYFVLPIDAVPDMLPLIGFTDDAAVLATAIKLVASNITPAHRAAARRALQRGLQSE